MSDHHQDASSPSSKISRLPLDLRQHKLSIALHSAPIVLTSCILPIIGYFALHYATSLSLKIIMSIFLALMGGVSLLAFYTRAWALWRIDSDCRPLGLENRWAFDYFFWNFVFNFCVLTALISSGITTENLQIVSLPLSILVLWVSLQMVIAEVSLALHAKVPFRMSSLQKGDVLRPGIYVIVEDVVAVDGKQGRAWRQAWNDRYLSSPVFRHFLSQMDRMWAATGFSVVAIIWGVVFGLENHEIGYALGWALPFAWGAGMGFITTVLAKRMLRKEETLELDECPTTGRGPSPA
ncbi:hypothetical protein N7492_007441 [Penicillium capsulatum]|uniref:Uncharacterized protein n=1 Tax=Penicillium capsulatum TaxID=69766 RepID=A0A9W9LLP7_9EURO|nr:hypothetical protein N7492_007441 [Penicillium capsulatum]KAJ6117276.1 hypothetical protein N7512_007001 [Penicillium capsulatum]